jgi:DNA invertase Pin-like site-specific DNA recombinase
MDHGQKIGYTRVSTADQNSAWQFEGLTLDRTFAHKASGKDTHRPALEAALGFVREGDTLIVHSTDRRARNVDDPRRIVLALTKRGVKAH